MRLLFVIGFEPDDILATSPKDGSIRYKEKEFLETAPGPTLTPTELVAQTKPDEHNEVVLRSDNLRILGVAVKHMVRHDGVVDTPAYADELRSLARERGLPIIELRQPCLLEDEVRVGKNKEGVVSGVLLHHNGIGYSLSEHWQQRYFHPIQCDWEDISETEYQKIRPLLSAALKGHKGGAEFLQTVDVATERRFRD